MNRLNQRQGFLISAIVHLVMLMALVRQPAVAPKPIPPPPVPPEERRERVFLPPPEVLRQLIPLVPRPAVPPPMPQPNLTAPSPRAKDRISIGPPSTERAKGPLILRKEDDLTVVPKGRPDAVPSPPPTAPPRVPENGRSSPERGSSGAPDATGDGALRLAPGAGTLPRGLGPRAERGSGEPSISSSLRNLDRRLAETGPRGLPEGTGTGQQMGPLFFDPEGADFTVWINHFKNEVYRNWIVPQPALLGFRGHVDLEFTVERDGKLTNLRMLKSSGTPALDRAAENALVGSRFQPLPSDYGPPRVTMQVSFFYNEGPRGS